MSISIVMIAGIAGAASDTWAGSAVVVEAGVFWLSAQKEQKIKINL